MGGKKAIRLRNRDKKEKGKKRKMPSKGKGQIRKPGDKKETDRSEIYIMKYVN